MGTIAMLRMQTLPESLKSLPIYAEARPLDRLIIMQRPILAWSMNLSDLEATKVCFPKEHFMHD